MKRSEGFSAFLIAIAAAGTLTGCAATRGLLAMNSTEEEEARPIQNPFGDVLPGQQAEARQQTMVFRSKKGDRSVEVEIPRSDRGVGDLTLPVAPNFREERSPASQASSDEGGFDESYKGRKPSPSDREIGSTFPQGAPEDEGRRREIEQDLGLAPAEDPTPQQETSYLAGIDHIKQLYRRGRYEAALLEVDEMIVKYQTDPKLYEMRGTLLERVGKPDLALKSWNQALRLEPSNAALRKLVERRTQRRGVASQ